MMQGLFREEALADGRLGFANDLKNRNLAYNLTDSAAREIGIEAREMQQLRSGEPLRLDVLRDLVKRIDLYHRERGVSIR
jgi:hypothetical protein